jgi:hypothetical protein
MYKVVFGWLKKGGIPTGAELKALLALMEPVLKQMKIKRPPINELDERLIQLFGPVYEYYALYSTKPESFWKGLGRDFTEVKALTNYRNEARALCKSLYPPKPKGEKKPKKAKAEKK